jgi:hypothetical protein
VLTFWSPLAFWRDALYCRGTEDASKAGLVSAAFRLWGSSPLRLC